MSLDKYPDIRQRLSQGDIDFLEMVGTSDHTPDPADLDTNETYLVNPTDLPALLAEDRSHFANIDYKDVQHRIPGDETPALSDEQWLEVARFGIKLDLLSLSSALDLIIQSNDAFYKELPEIFSSLDTYRVILDTYDVQKCYFMSTEQYSKMVAKNLFPHIEDPSYISGMNYVFDSNGVVTSAFVYHQNRIFSFFVNEETAAVTLTDSHIVKNRKNGGYSELKLNDVLVEYDDHLKSCGAATLSLYGSESTRTLPLNFEAKSKSREFKSPIIKPHIIGEETKEAPNENDVLNGVNNLNDAVSLGLSGLEQSRRKEDLFYQTLLQNLLDSTPGHFNLNPDTIQVREDEEAYKLVDLVKGFSTPGFNQELRPMAIEGRVGNNTKYLYFFENGFLEFTYTNDNGVITLTEEYCELSKDGKELQSFVKVELTKDTRIGSKGILTIYPGDDTKKPKKIVLGSGEL